MKAELWPLCAVCKRPVERMESSRDTLAHSYTFVAHCHGASQTLVMPEGMLQDALLIGAALAFADPTVRKVVRTLRGRIEYYTVDDGWGHWVFPAVEW